MNIAIVVATLVLLIQGTRIVIRPGAPAYVRCFGVLTLLLGTLSFVLFAILSWGEAVLSPEFDVVMTRGHWRGLVTLLIGFAVAAGLGLHAQRVKTDLPGRLGGLLFIGIVVGSAAAARITHLQAGVGGEDAGSAFWIYSYDLWWPPLLIWVSACFLDGAITILGVRDRRVRTAAFLVMLLALSLKALGRQMFTDPTSAPLWRLSAALSIAGAAVLAGYVIWTSMVGRARASLPPPFSGWGAAAAARDVWARAIAGGWPEIGAQVWRRLRPVAGQVLAVLALLTIAASLADIFYVGALPQAGALVILAIAWTCLAEVTAQGPLRAFVVNIVPEVVAALARQESWVRQVWLILRAHLAGPLSQLGAALRRLVSLRPFPEALMKIAVLFVAMVIAYEVPHARRTLLQPFTAVAVSLKKDPAEVPTITPQPEIGRAVFEYLVNTLGALTVELQPDVILLLPPDPERGARFRTLAAGGSGSIDLFLAQSPDIDLGGVKVPMGFLLTPVLQPVRSLLGVRVVTGSVLADPEGYTILVRSNAGEMWRARLGNQDDADVMPAARGRIGAGPDRAFSRLSLELAFRIMSAEPTLATFGMTRSWDAFEHFNQGLDRWRTFVLHRGLGEPAALSEAIQRFRAATAVDPGFALAHYRLGLALDNDGQPLAAAESLRAALKANPGFVPAMVALASVVYLSEQEPAAPILISSEPRTAAADRAGRREAKRLWQSVITTPGASSLDRAAAWAGLCRHALDEPDDDARDSDREPARHHDSDASKVSYRVAYFHCQQAERLYASLVATPRDDLRVKTARASELASIGMLLERYGPRRDMRNSTQWQCSRAALPEQSLTGSWDAQAYALPVRHYTPAALGYYRKALKLLPDDAVLRCHEASAELAVSGRGSLMRALETEASSRWNLAESYRHEARRRMALVARADRDGSAAADDAAKRQRDVKLAAAYFYRALGEYRATQERDPANFEALTRYANLFWEWRHGETRVHGLVGPGLEHGRTAELSARRAIAVIQSKRVDIAEAREATATGRAAPSRDDGAIIAPATFVEGDSGQRRDPTEPRRNDVPAHLGAAVATAYASLGAALLAQTRAHEAIEELEVAYRQAPPHLSFDHVGWMLAQAHLCAASRTFQAIRSEATRDGLRLAGASRDGDSRWNTIADHRERARPLLEVIRTHERVREAPIFGAFTDVARSDKLCRTEWLATTVARGDLRYELQQVDNGRHRDLCKWRGVRVTPPEESHDDRAETLYLHVWGGTVDERVPVKSTEPVWRDSSGRPRRADPLPITPTSKPSYYFAQLEDAGKRPVSMPLALRHTGLEQADIPASQAAPAGGSDAGAPSAAATLRCPNAANLIQLTFESRDTIARAAPREEEP